MRTRRFVRLCSPYSSILKILEEGYIWEFSKEVEDLRHFEQVLVGGVLGDGNVAQIFLKRVFNLYEISISLYN
jgi:hypothetical protein